MNRSCTSRFVVSRLHKCAWSIQYTWSPGYKRRVLVWLPWKQWEEGAVGTTTNAGCAVWFYPSNYRPTSLIICRYQF